VIGDEPYNTGKDPDPSEKAVCKVKAEPAFRFCRGYTDVVDADLSKYFDSIPHCELLKSVARRIVDRHVLREEQRARRAAGRCRELLLANI
jgi:hypothetical protein